LTIFIGQSLQHRIRVDGLPYGLLDGHLGNRLSADNGSGVNEIKHMLA